MYFSHIKHNTKNFKIFNPEDPKKCLIIKISEDSKIINVKKKNAQI